LKDENLENMITLFIELNLGRYNLSIFLPK
jgi:hypothetical protein